jgi:hypothetical protein
MFAGLKRSVSSFTEILDSEIHFFLFEEQPSGFLKLLTCEVRITFLEFFQGFVDMFLGSLYWVSSEK